MEGEGTTMGGEVSVVAALARLARAERENRERLSALERQNRRMKAVVVGMLVCVAAVGTMAAWQPKVVVANEFVLKDKQGRPRARLGFAADTDRPRLGFYDRQGQCRVRLGLEPRNQGSPELTLYDGRGVRGVNLALESSDDCRYAALNLFDSSGYSPVALYLNDDRSAGLSIAGFRNAASIGCDVGDGDDPGEAWVTVEERPPGWMMWFVEHLHADKVRAQDDILGPRPPPWGGVTMGAVQGQGGSMEVRNTNGDAIWGAP